MNTTVILVLAAGASRRMRGRDKLLEPVAGQPLLRRQARAALATGQPVIVTLPASAGARGAALAGLDLRVVEVADAAQGMGHSLAAGARAAPAETPLLVMLADMPEIGTPELARLLQAHDAAPDTILRGSTTEGVAGHPVLFPARLRAALLGLRGDEGARQILKHEAVQLVALPGQAAATDLDTPEDWAAWRGAGGG